MSAGHAHINMASSHSMAQEHQYGFRPRITASPLVATWTRNISTDPLQWDHRPRHGPWRQHGPWTSTRLQDAAQTIDICLAFGGNIDHGQQHNGSNRTTDPGVALSGSRDHTHQHGLRQLLRPFTSTWPSAVARLMDISMASCGSSDQGHLCSL